MSIQLHNNHNNIHSLFGVLVFFHSAYTHSESRVKKLEEKLEKSKQQAEHVKQQCEEQRYVRSIILKQRRKRNKRGKDLYYYRTGRTRAERELRNVMNKVVVSSLSFPLFHLHFFPPFSTPPPLALLSFPSLTLILQHGDTNTEGNPPSDKGGVQPIGFIESCFRERNGTPRQGLLVTQGRYEERRGRGRGRESVEGRLSREREKGKDERGREGERGTRAYIQKGEGELFIFRLFILFSFQRVIETKAVTDGRFAHPGGP